MSRVSACPVIVAMYACGVDVEKGPIRQQLWNAPPCDNVESWFGGAIAYDSRPPLLRIQGTKTAQRYVDDVLRPVTLPYLQGVPNALHQQDNARPHTARISQQALQDVQMLPWPPYSPDLSPIEHVWDIIGRRLHALPQPRSEDELWQMVEREWRAIPQDAIRTLIDSLPRRVAACIAVRDRTIDQYNINVPSCFKSKLVYQPNFRPLPLPNLEDSYLNNDDKLQNNFYILLSRYNDIFGENKYNIRPLKVEPPRLRLKDKTPVCLRPYRHNPRDTEIIKEQIRQLLKYGIIRHASSPYSSPVTLAHKKGENDKSRLCIDFRKLNSKLIGDSFPIPLVENIIQKVQGSKVFSCLDILSAYWTIGLHEKDQPITCFTTTEGSYQWCRLPFELRTAPAIFNRMLTSILQKYELKNIISYFDDILVFSKDTESHLEHLGEIFTILQEEGIQLRKDKCLFFMQKINYLGYEIFGDQISPSSTKSVKKPTTPSYGLMGNLPLAEKPFDVVALDSILGLGDYNSTNNCLHVIVDHHSRYIWAYPSERDEVLYKIPYQSGQGKLMPAFYPEPYTIISIPSPQTIEIDKPCQPENKHATIVNISKIKLWDPVTEDNTEPPFPFQEEEDLEGCLGFEPNKQASTDSPQVLFSSIKEKKIQITPQSPWRNYCRFRENNKKSCSGMGFYMESASIDMSKF
ncbi:hypothetical protein LAZ67_6003244 [Cordylochernes scorpioides]|uniref:Reverse transcriptase domain-containing protein n=1 Tax=Cordylochernes scorpioides TaxID=51811 RepID=A0ABY6KL16_9ARAC|nr:hypothetical protein LAZ67_6003244 [Cordylochernes scorpioides]